MHLSRRGFALAASLIFVPSLLAAQTYPNKNDPRNDLKPGRLDAAKGADFDHAYLTMMIQHHEGALQMVDDLLAAPLAAQDVDVGVFANDVVTVQTAEIGVMQRMLSKMSDK